MMIRQHIDEAVRRFGDETAKRTESKRHIRTTNNRVGITSIGKYGPGTIAEGCFGLALRALAIRFIYRLSMHRMVGNRPEFVVYESGRPSDLDVKTRTKHWHDTFMEPLDKFRDPRSVSADYYVGSRPSRCGQFIEFWGYLTHDDMERLAAPERLTTWGELKALTISCPLHNLRPIEELLERLDRGERVIVTQ